MTFFIIKATRDTRADRRPRPRRVGAAGRRGLVRRHAHRRRDADDVDSVPVGTRHEIKVELARHKVYTETVDIPKNGGARCR